MKKKGINFFEKHVEKMVLGIVGVVCFWFLITRVLLSSNYIEYDNQKFNSGQIDNYIIAQAERLEEKLNHKPEPKEPYKPRQDAFVALMDSTMKGVDTNLYFPQPILSSRDVRDDRKYDLPDVGDVNEVAVGYIRAVAYIPTEIIDAENTYDTAAHEPNDFDFVTVEAKLDVRALYDRFYESFAGEYVKDEWRDPCLAVPVFAAVDLQRQELLADGWSAWQRVRRCKIDSRREMFKIIENVDDLPPGGMKVSMLQYDDMQILVDLLQPQSYQIASANEEWFSPLLHKKYLKVRKELEAHEKREARLAEKEERELSRSNIRSRRDSTAGGPLGGSSGPLGGGSMQGGSRRSSTSDRRSHTSRRTRTPEDDSERERTETEKELPNVEDIYEELDEILITDETDFSRMDEPLTFWSHDDTVEPGKSYRYRIRFGVFNPVAGTKQFSEEFKSFKDQVVLWSGFSDVTEAVDIPKTLYFFPYDIKEGTRTVTVKVCRYTLGYWYSKDFMVKGGEVIGRLVKYVPDEEEGKGGITFPDVIDYSTGAALLDVVAVSDWAGAKKLRSRRYFDMLYSFDGTSIEHMPVKVSYWTENIQTKFNEIRRFEKADKKPLRAWGDTERRDGTRTTPRGPMRGPMGGPMGGPFGPRPRR